MKSKKIILVILCTLFASSLYAQKLTMGYLYPAGGQVGTTIEIEAGGLNINKAVKVLFSHPEIKGEIVPEKPSPDGKKKRRRRGRLNDQSSPQLADRVKIKITIGANVPCGLYDLRLQGPKGVSNMLPFEVASFPNVLETKKKSSPTNPNLAGKLPAVLCGFVSPGGVDHFRFSGKKGETIVASVKARQLVPYIADAVPGWFQPVLRILDAQGKEVAYSDDYYHYVDPVIITTLPKSGNYTLIIHDAIYRGREDFNYRIHIGTIPFVTGRYPAFGIAGKKVKQTIEGVNLGTTDVVAKVKKEGYNQISFTNAIGTSNHVPFYTLPRGTKLIQFPKKDTKLSLFNAISDSLTSDARIKRYYIDAERNQEVIVELIGRRNGSRMDAVIRLRDGFGNVVAEVDDTEDPKQGLMTFHADPILKFMPKRTEEMVLEVEDRHRGYGKDYYYLLRMHRQLPTFNAFVSPANITIPSGGTSQFRVDVTGKLKRPARLEVHGLPNGYTTSNLKLRGRRWNVSITSPKGAAVRRFPIEVKLNYPGPDGREIADVLPVDNMMQAFYYTHHIQAAELALDVVEPSPYRMSVDIDIQEDIEISLDDRVITLKVSVDKDANFTDPIELALGNKNKLFSLEPVSIMPNETEKVIQIKLDEAMMERYKTRKGKPNWQMHIVGTVKGEIIQRGRRRIQNAKYSEMTPIFNIRLKR